MTPRARDTGLPPRQRRPLATPSGVDVPAWNGRRAAAALDRVRAHGRARVLPCVICTQPIDYGLRYPDGASCSVQHLKSRALHPELTWDPRNWAPAHLDCNRQAGTSSAPPIGLTTL